MNPTTTYSYDPKINLFEREEKLKKVQTYKRKNQKHPAFKR